MFLEKYNLVPCLIDNSVGMETSNESNLILSHFLMHWDNPIEITNTLIPWINFGMKYGTEDRYCKYADVQGMEEKMKERWTKSNKEGVRQKMDIDKSWDRISNYTGYYISEFDFWLEGIGADVCGIAFVTSNSTTIEASELGHFNIEFPSVDIKEMVLEWLLFILRNTVILPRKL